MKIYLAELSTGQYDDHRTQIIGAFDNERKATELRDDYKKWINQLALVPDKFSEEDESRYYADELSDEKDFEVKNLIEAKLWRQDKINDFNCVTVFSIELNEMPDFADL